jgi:hypothetical protein
MESILRSAFKARIEQAQPNWRGNPVVRLQEDVSVDFKPGYVDVIQGINLIVRIDHVNKVYMTKYTKVKIVRLAEQMLEAEGYTRAKE